MQIKLLYEGYSEIKIAKQLGGRTTVTKYLNKNSEETAIWLDFTKSRTENPDKYDKIITDWLRKHPDTSATIIYDRFEEK